MYLYKVGTWSSILINKGSLFQRCPLRCNLRGGQRLHAPVHKRSTLGAGQGKLAHESVKTYRS